MGGDGAPRGATSSFRTLRCVASGEGRGTARRSMCGDFCPRGPRFRARHRTGLRARSVPGRLSPPIVRAHVQPSKAAGRNASGRLPQGLPGAGLRAPPAGAAPALRPVARSWPGREGCRISGTRRDRRSAFRTVSRRRPSREQGDRKIGLYKDYCQAECENILQVTRRLERRPAACGRAAGSAPRPGCPRRGAASRPSAK